ILSAKLKQAQTTCLSRSLLNLLLKMTKKEVCNYCESEHDSKALFTTRKVFAGVKVLDILQTITKRSIPVSTPIKMCGLCMAAMLSATAIIAKTDQLVSKTLKSGKGNEANECKAANDEAESTTEATSLQVETIATNGKASPLKQASNVNGETVKEIEKEVQGTPKKQALKKKSSAVTAEVSKVTKSLFGGNKSEQHSSKTEVEKTNKSLSTPSKLQQNSNNLDKSLTDVVKLTPAKEASAKHKDFNQLFSVSNNAINLSTDSEDDAQEASKTPNKLNIAIHFECKLCDFKSVWPNPMKLHMKTEHDQKRPRIYDCSKCPRSFGVLKTLKEHLVTHGVVEEKSTPNPEVEPQPESDTTLAKLTALKPRSKSKSALTAEYTFAVTTKNSSTPKPGDVQGAGHKCGYCQIDLKNLKAIKEHMKQVHSIDRPKPFKCNLCECEYMHKITLNQHVKTKHGETAEPKNPSPNAAADSPKPKESVPTSRKRKTNDFDTSLVEQADKSKKQKIVKEDVAVTPSKTKPTEAASPRKEKKVATPKSNEEDTVDAPDEIPIAHSPVTPMSPVKKRKSVSNEHQPSEKLPVDTPSKKSGEQSKMEQLLEATAVLETSISSSQKKKSKKKSLLAAEEQELQQPAEQLDGINTLVQPNKRTLLVDSIEVSHSESELSCSKCGKLAKSRQRLDSHIRKRHGTQLKCPNCWLSYPNSLEYISHFATCDASDGLACGVKNCPKKFEGAHYLTSHLKKKHGVN
ncbi:zinc finger protein CG2199, partial [Drosophila busckii]|uniref:zinc finger protein CG2199 n=1 Tax=Drosophila busckii TaxID=30019 RepID=UPI00083EC23D